MYERFTDRARKVLQLANQEAQRFNHEYIGTEHILLGLASEGSGVAANVLKSLGVDLTEIRLEVEKLVARRPDNVVLSKLPQSPRAKKVIEHSMEEARNLGHNYVGTEHILLGLLREQETVAAQVLMNLGLRLETVRSEVLALLGVASNKDEREAYNPPPPIRWIEDEAIGDVDQPDDETKNRARQLAEDIVTHQRDKEEAVANQDFPQAAQLRDKEREARREFAAISLPAWLRRNIEQAAGFTSALKCPCLGTLAPVHDKAGEPDAGVLSVFPSPVTPPVKFVVKIVPQFPVSTLNVALSLDDLGSPYYQARIPLISREWLARVTGGKREFLRRAFDEVERAADAARGCAVVLCIVRPTALSEDVQKELFAGIHRTGCQFVVFGEPSEIRAVLGKLPPETKLLGE